MSGSQQFDQVSGERPCRGYRQSEAERPTDSTVKEDVKMAAPESPNKQMTETEQPAESNAWVKLTAEVAEHTKQIEEIDDTTIASGNDIFQLQEHTRCLEDTIDELSKEVRGLKLWLTELNAVVVEMKKHGGQAPEDVMQRFVARMTRLQGQHEVGFNATAPFSANDDDGGRFTRLEQAVHDLIMNDTTNGVIRLGM